MSFYFVFYFIWLFRSFLLNIPHMVQCVVALTAQMSFDNMYLLHTVCLLFLIFAHRFHKVRGCGSL